ncbi:MAG: hypothetical protein QOF70_6261 [Acetobacteraceae bacterium]|jgi:hypothetical protein|nr:hypothetical protein [Acetobacteraceae bacterium]
MTPPFSFEANVIRPGEYFAIRQPEQEQRFLVVRVSKATSESGLWEWAVNASMKSLAC